MYYKLTNRSAWPDYDPREVEGRSRSYDLFASPGLQWGENVTHHAEGQGSKFYSNDYIYVYDNPLVAVLLNPIHANFPRPLLWEADAVDVQSDIGLKFGAKEVTTLRQIPVPEVSTEQTVRFGILCALAVSKKAQFQSWAEAWLSKTYKAHEVTEWAEWEAAIQSEKAAEAAETGAWNAAQETWREWSASSAAEQGPFSGGRDPGYFEQYAMGFDSGLIQWEDRTFALPEPTWDHRAHEQRYRTFKEEWERWAETIKSVSLEDMRTHWPSGEINDAAVEEYPGAPWFSEAWRLEWAAGFGNRMAAKWAAIAAFAAVEVSWWAAGDTNTPPQFPLAALAAAATQSQ